jgi:hypothetical protein
VAGGICGKKGAYFPFASANARPKASFYAPLSAFEGKA